MATLQTEKRRAEGKRIQFEFPPEASERLDRMKDVTESASYAELVRNALRIYEWVVEQEKAGYDIGLVKDDTLIKTVKFRY